MPKVRATTSNPDLLPVPERHEKWKAPTGRYIVRGQTCMIDGERGKWKFLAYVDSPTQPHVEVKKASKSAGPIRCFAPERVYGVSTADPLDD